MFDMLLHLFSVLFLLLTLRVTGRAHFIHLFIAETSIVMLVGTAPVGHGGGGVTCLSPSCVSVSVCPSDSSCCGFSSMNNKNEPDWPLFYQGAAANTSKSQEASSSGSRGTGTGTRTHHLLDPVEALSMKAEGLFKQDLVLHRPLVWKWCEVWEISQGLVDIVFVPEEHP